MRIDAAWPAPRLDGEASDLYREVLDDVAAADALTAITALVRAGAETRPAPGPLRQTILETMRAPHPPARPTATAPAAAPHPPTAGPAAGPPAPTAAAGEDDSRGFWALALAILLAPVGLVLGIIAVRRLPAGRRGLAIAAIVIGGTLTTLGAVGVVANLLRVEGQDPVEELEQDILDSGDFTLAVGLSEAPIAVRCVPGAVNAYRCIIDFPSRRNVPYDVRVADDGSWSAAPDGPREP